MQLTMLSNLFDIAFQGTDAVPDLPSVHFQFCFAGTTCADSAAETRKVVSVPRQSCQPVGKLRQFNLELTFLSASPARENIEDEPGSIHDFRVERLFQILLLTGRKHVIEDDDIDSFNKDLVAKLVYFSLSDVGGGIGPVPPLDDFIDDARAGRNGQLSQLIQRIGTD